MRSATIVGPRALVFASEGDSGQGVLLSPVEAVATSAVGDLRSHVASVSSQAGGQAVVPGQLGDLRRLLQGVI
jgi:hypothetical protein